VGPALALIITPLPPKMFVTELLLFAPIVLMYDCNDCVTVAAILPV